MKFSDLNLQKNVLKALTEAGYKEPTPIQEQAIPALMQGKDVLACAQTGTGKTCAFALPIIETLSTRQGGRFDIRALILTPTRELALQIYENVCQYARYTNCMAAVIFGGVPQGAQVQALRRGVDILIATPGRLWDLMEQGFIKLGNTEFFVLDEADRMLDMGFFPDVKRVVKKLPAKRQTMLFSATIPAEIASLAEDMLNQPVKISVAPSAKPADLIEQQIYYVEKQQKRDLLIELLQEKNVSQTLVFTRTKHGADRVAREINRAGIKAKAIHGDKTQNQRQRALSDFKDMKIAVLVATDIAARGIDITDLPLVINYDVPNVPETYVHRIGRTGRAGHEGVAISICDGSERPYVKDIQKLIGHQIPVMSGEGVTADERMQKRGVKRVSAEKRKPVASNRLPKGKDAPKRTGEKQGTRAPRKTEQAAASVAPVASSRNRKSANTQNQYKGSQRRRGGMRGYEDKNERRYDAHTPTRSDALSNEAKERIRRKVQNTLQARETQDASKKKSIKRTEKNVARPRRTGARNSKGQR